MSDKQAMGMMSGVYFVGRQELLNWVNELLSISYTKVEDTSNGAAFCQVIDACHPGTVRLKSVKYDAYQAPDIVNNYKVLQEAFDKNGIKQYIDVDTLVKGKYMAALELFQWIHGYFRQFYPSGTTCDYDAVARRKQCHVKEPSGSTVPNVKPAGMAKRHNPINHVQAHNDNIPVGAIPGSKARPKIVATHQVKDVPTVANVDRPVNVGDRKPAAAAAAERKAAAPAERKPARAAVAEKPAGAARVPVAAGVSEADKRELREAKKRVKELEEEVEQANSERDFYYERLRKIEDFCQDHDDLDVIKELLEVLYETDEENGFVAPTGDDDDYDE